MTKIPQELIQRAIDNLTPRLRTMPEGQRMNNLVDAEIRRLMKQRYPDVKVLERDITNALVGLSKSLTAQRPATKIQPKVMPKDEEADLNRLVGQMSGFIKMMMGVADNCALTVMRHANDQIIDRRSDDDYKVKPRKAHPGYRLMAKKHLKEAMQEVNRWRTRLLYPSHGELRFFHVDDMPQEARQKYAKMTDQEYFEFWMATGAGAYQKSLPLIRSLHHKFERSMADHGVPAASQTAWGLTALTILQLAVETWERSMRSVNEAMEGRLPPAMMERIYRPFSLQRVCDLWQQGLVLLSPQTATYKLTSQEERNIELGVQQLRETWIDPTLPFESLAGAVQDYDELFASKSSRRQIISDINQMRIEAENDVRRLREEELKRKHGITE